MNTNLLNIIKRITAQYGEGILGDAARLRGIVNDLAKDEPKEDRVAFGRAIEQGFYQELKRAAPHARALVKTALVSRLQSVTGFDAGRCAAAVDLLEAAIAPGAQPAYQQPPPPANWGNAASGENGVAYSGGAASSGGAHASGTPPAALTGKLSRKTLIFGAAAGAGALVGELVSELFRVNGDDPTSFFRLVLNVGIWAAFIGLGISAALVIAQTFYLKKKLVIEMLIKSALIGIGVGVAGGAAAQIIFGLTSDISTFVEIFSRLICWGILGWGLGWGVSFYVPNYPAKRAMLAGLAGGVVGGAFFRATFSLPEPFGRVIGITILGLFIGLAISFVEEALREAWLTVIWGPKESVTISLGTKPIVFGSSREADVYLPVRRDVPALPIRAVVALENGRVVLDDKAAGRRSVLQNGGEFTLDRLRVVVNTKS